MMLKIMTFKMYYGRDSDILITKSSKNGNTSAPREYSLKLKSYNKLSSTCNQLVSEDTTVGKED
jgi:hypothetical protein